MELLVTRRWKTPVSTCGMLDLDGVFQCYTLERQTYKDGMPKPYAIPLGGPYEVLLLPSYHFGSEVPRPKWYQGLVPHIGGVEGFTGLEIHPANWPSDLRGCTGVGDQHQEDIQDIRTHVRGGAVFGSDAAFARLMEILQKAVAPIRITYQEATIQ